ncbi:MAG: glycine cleavage system protein GcvH [Sedimentitalea sp.]
MKFTEEHQWLLEEGDVIVVGITEHGVEQLGDIVFVDLPEEGDEVTADEAVVVIEGAEETMDFLSPLDGEIVDVNPALSGQPTLLNEDATGAGWLFKISASDVSAMEDYLDEAAYRRFVA